MIQYQQNDFILGDKKLNNNKVTCLVCGKEFHLIDGMFLADLDSRIRGHIRHDHPRATPHAFICNDDLLQYRLNSIDRFIKNDLKHNQKLNNKLTKKINNKDYKITDVNYVLKNQLSLGDRVADTVARFGGSWTFIFIFSGIMIAWMLVNGLQLFGIHFDPYPFVLLNLFLSTVAALQAPLIMMSQNRASDRDRMNSENDYHVNQRSEEEIRMLHAKMDHLIQTEWPNLLETQKMQFQMLAELQAKLAVMDPNDTKVSTTSVKKEEATIINDVKNEIKSADKKEK